MSVPRVLVVEDETIVARDIREQLVELGYEPIADTARGEDAIVLAGKLRPDVILMDIQLAGALDGIGAAEAIRDQFAIPVVFLTAFAGDATLARAKLAEPYGYIVKPFDARDLRSVIEISLYKARAERRLRESERNLQQAQEVGGVGSGEYDFTTGRCINSPVLDALLGIDATYPATWQARAAMVHPSQRTQVIDAMTQAVAERRPFEREVLMVRADNAQERWFNVRADVEYDTGGNALRAICTLQDITARRHAETELREALALFDDVVASQPAGIYRIRVKPDGDWRSANDPAYIYEFVSDRYCELRARTREELLRDPYLTVNAVHPDDRDRFIAANEVAGRTQEPFLWEGRMLRDGETRWVHLESRPRAHSSGDTIWTGVMFDITEQHKLLEDKAALEARNRQLQKAESLGRMAGAVAHHFNNLLGAVMGNLDLAMTEPPGSDEHAELLDEAMAAARQAADVSGQMLAYVGESFAKRSRFDLAIACTAALQNLRAAAPAQGTLDAVIPARGPVVRMNELQLQQVLANLVSNGWEAIGSRPGTVRLEVGTMDAASVPVASRFPLDWRTVDPAYACVTVSDTGAGITPEDIDQVFDPFYSTKFVGRGLGLAVTLGIVRANGGAIAVASEPGKGASFRVLLPLAKP